VLRHEDPVVTYLVIDGELIETTPEHPFYTQERGWVAAGELWIGAHVRKADGTFGVVESIGFAYRPQPMYNLTVAEAHTFFVGEQQWLVHNTCDGNVHLDPVKVDNRGRWHATEDFTYSGNGKAYEKGQYVPDEAGFRHLAQDPRRPGLPPRTDGGWQKNRQMLNMTRYATLIRNNKPVVYVDLSKRTWGSGIGIRENTTSSGERLVAIGGQGIGDVDFGKDRN
jgi:hypothetical protein